MRGVHTMTIITALILLVIALFFCTKAAMAGTTDVLIAMFTNEVGGLD